MKNVRLTPKEIGRGVEYGYKPGSWVIVTRPRPDGQYWVAVVDTMSGQLVADSFQTYTESKQGLSAVVGKLVRDMDKFSGLSNKMTSRGRDRFNGKIEAQLK